MLSHIRVMNVAENVRKQGALRIFDSKGEEVAEFLRKLHSMRLYDLCDSPDIIRIITS
jgi:hypothetical protein